MTYQDIQNRIIDWTGTKPSITDIDNIVWTIVNDTELFKEILNRRSEVERIFTNSERTLNEKQSF